MYDEMGWTRYVMTIGTSAIAASSVVVPDLQIPASAAAKTSSGSPMCTVIAPGSGYSASGVPATMICTSGRAEVTRAAASRKIAQCRFTSCARLPGNKRSEEHTSELQSRLHLVCRLLLEKKKKRMVN